MNDAVETFDVPRKDVAHILAEGERARAPIVIKPAVAVVAAINPDDLELLLKQTWPENSANIPVDTGNQHSHFRHVRLVQYRKLR
jgi:hypothetical protein